MTIPPKEVNISENDKSFLGENLSARTPPKIYDKNFNTFIDLEEEDCSIISYFENYSDYELIAPRDYVLEKCK